MKENQSNTPAPSHHGNGMTGTVDQPPAPASERRHDLDALRAFAMLLGIALHITLSLAGIQWVVWDTVSSKFLLLLMLSIHGFRMQLFFIISGYFTAMLVARRGTLPMLRNRAVRILVPCLLGLATVVPLNNWVSRMTPVWNPTHPGEPLQDAISRDDTIRMRQLLENGTDIEAPDSRLKIRPLGWAILCNNDTAVRLLLEKGADPMATAGNQANALCIAAFAGRPDILKLLVANGGDPLASNANGVTPWITTFSNTYFTKGILRTIKNSEPGDSEMAAIEMGRGEVRAFLGERIATSSLSGATSGEAPPSSALAAPGAKAAAPPDWLINYTLALASDRYRLSVGGWTWHLFEDSTFVHLWFLWTLCWLVVLFSLIRAFNRRCFPAFANWIPPLGPSLAVAMALTLLPQFCMSVAVFPGAPPGSIGPDTSSAILPKPHVFAYYAVFFFFGTVCFRNNDESGRLGARWKICLPLACVVLFPAILLTLHNRVLNTPIQVAYTWLMSLSLMGLFRLVLNRQNKAIRYVSDSSYWLYLAHLPLVIAMQCWVSDWPLPAWVKFLLMLSISTALLLASYQLLVRDKPIDWLLNGRVRK